MKNLNKRPVTVKLVMWGDGVFLSLKDWRKIVRYLKRAGIDVEELGKSKVVKK